MIKISNTAHKCVEYYRGSITIAFPNIDNALWQFDIAKTIDDTGVSYGIHSLAGQDFISDEHWAIIANTILANINQVEWKAYASHV